MLGICGTIFGLSWAGRAKGAGLGKTRRTNKEGEAPPVSVFEAVPGVPRVKVLRLLGGERARGVSPGELSGTVHSHEFLVLCYFERGGGSVRLGAREWPVKDGDAYVISPGEVVGLGGADGFEGAEGWTAFFPPEVLGSRAPGAFLSWRAHPLLFPFARGVGNPDAQRLRVPPAERDSWSERFASLYDELRRRRDGYREAVHSHLTLLLVELSRLATDVVGDFRLKDEPLLAEVFAFIEEHYHERISLKEVARALGLSSGHLTTIVRRKTGRTVLEWIAERRMAEVRRLLVETNFPVGEIGRRVGYADAHYLVRVFRRGHGVTPLGWRRAGRP